MDKQVLCNAIELAVRLLRQQLLDEAEAIGAAIDTGLLAYTGKSGAYGFPLPVSIKFTPRGPTCGVKVAATVTTKHRSEQASETEDARVPPLPGGPLDEITAPVFGDNSKALILTVNGYTVVSKSQDRKVYLVWDEIKNDWLSHPHKTIRECDEAFAYELSQGAVDVRNISRVLAKKYNLDV